MGCRHKVQDATGVVDYVPVLGAIQVASKTVPADGSVGFARGCILHKLDGTAGTQFYINEGTESSCDFNPLVLPGVNLSGLTATAAELNTLHSQTLATGAGAGVTDGVGTVYKNSVQLSGGIYLTRVLVDLTGLASSTTDLDIIGTGTSAAHLGQLTAAQCGTVLGGKMTCLEVPAGGVADIDLYWAVEATGKFDDAVTGLTETALITAGGSWTLALQKAIADPVGIANGYLYLTGGAAGTAAAYTAGKFLIELYGY
jgi:hypothetical protein